MANWKNREFNELRRSNKVAWDVVWENSQFREKLGKLLLTEEDLKTQHPKLGLMYKAWGHPDLMPLLLERIEKLLEKKNG